MAKRVSRLNFQDLRNTKTTNEIFMGKKNPAKDEQIKGGAGEYFASFNHHDKAFQWKK